jgi:outer membrane lipoprotein-sorting protein
MCYQFPFIAVLLVPATVPAQENEAEKQFRAMENKVRAIKAMKLVCELEGTIDGKGGTIKVKVIQQFADGNKARFELESQEGDKAYKRLQISDGMQVVIREDGKPAGKPQPVDPNLNKGLPAAIARGGFMLPRLILRYDKGPFDSEKLLKVSDFKLGSKERIGDVEAQAVEYAVTLGGESLAFGDCEKVNVTVWIDPKTMVPLKRKVAAVDKKDHFFVEIYREFALDPKLDAKVFELPK